MSFLQILQEASTLSLVSLKKAMSKDGKASLLLKKQLSLSDIPSPESFLATAKYYIFNNENVRAFVNSREDLKAISSVTFDTLKKLKAADLTQQHVDDLLQLTATIFKEHNATSRGTFSANLKKELSTWLNSNGGYFRLSPGAIKELKSIPSVRPSKKIVVYRGVLFSEYSLKSRDKYDGTLEIGNGLKFLKEIRKGGKEVDLSWDHPSSWTTDKSVADKFAKYGPANSSFAATLQWMHRGSGKRAIDGELGYVISTLADPEDVLVDTAFINGVELRHGNESEVILAPGEYHCRIVKKYTVEGEVEVAAPSEKNKALEALENMSDFLKTYSTPKEVSVIDKIQWNISSNSIYLMLQNPDAFKQLLLNSATTISAHSFDKIRDAYLKDFHGVDKKYLNAAAVEGDDHDRLQAVKAFVKVFDENSVHSKFGKDTGKIHQLTGEEYRQTFKAFDLSSIEKDLLTTGKISSSESARYFKNYAGVLGVELPSSAGLNMFGAAKQEPYLQQVVDKFFNLVNLSKGDNLIDNYKTMINLCRKAYRNYRMFQFLKDLESKISKLNGESAK